MKGLLGLVAAVLAAGAPQPQPREVLVSAAVSLTESLRGVAARYESRHGERVVLNLGASNTLARQIAAGARVDVFISADEAQMKVVAADLAPGTRVELLSNQLAVAVAPGRAARVRTALDLADGSIRRIAIGDPAAVPAGVYARTYLERIGIWAQLQPKLVPSGSVRLALAAVENEAADAAIVYRTDIATSDRLVEAFVVPAADGPRIVYPAAVIRSAPNRDGGMRFLAFLKTPEARAIFVRAGFIPLP
jgi:molybdate transport system substrate-binding protein